MSNYDNYNNCYNNNKSSLFNTDTINNLKHSKFQITPESKNYLTVPKNYTPSMQIQGNCCYRTTGSSVRSGGLLGPPK